MSAVFSSTPVQTARDVFRGANLGGQLKPRARLAFPKRCFYLLRILKIIFISFPVYFPKTYKIVNIFLICFRTGNTLWSAYRGMHFALMRL